MRLCVCALVVVDDFVANVLQEHVEMQALQSVSQSALSLCLSLPLPLSLPVSVFISLSLSVCFSLSLTDSHTRSLSLFHLTLSVPSFLSIYHTLSHTPIPPLISLSL